MQLPALSMHLPNLTTLRKKIGLGTGTDAISLLKRDHREVDAMFMAFDKAKSAREKKRIATQVCTALTVHAAIEEKLFYPCARACLDDAFLVKEAEVEHQHLKELVGEIESMNASDDMFEAKMRVLMEYVRHHVREEEGEMFPMLRATEMDMEEMGRKLMAKREQLMRGRQSNGHAKSNGHARSSGRRRSNGR